MFVGRGTINGGLVVGKTISGGLVVGKTISGRLVVGKTISGRLVPLVACLPPVLSCFGVSHLSTVWSLLLGAVFAVR